MEVKLKVIPKFQHSGKLTSKDNKEYKKEQVIINPNDKFLYHRDFADVYRDSYGRRYSVYTEDDSLPTITSNRARRNIEKSFQVNTKPLDERSKYAVLDTYYPFISKQYPYTGHSSLTIIAKDNGTYRSYSINKYSKSKDYNLFTNNCSDATRCALEKTFNKKINPFLFTTPGDVQDFALEELHGIPRFKGDSIYSPVEHKYVLNKRKKKFNKKGENTIYIPLDENQRKFLKWYIKQEKIKEQK